MADKHSGTRHDPLRSPPQDSMTDGNGERNEPLAEECGSGRTPDRQRLHHHHRHHHRRNHSHDGADDLHSPQSPWISSSYTTPMTTRPHFEKTTHSPTPVLRRVRSRSLGAEVEAYSRGEDRLLRSPQHQQSATSEFGSLLLPKIRSKDDSMTTIPAKKSDTLQWAPDLVSSTQQQQQRVVHPPTLPSEFQDDEASSESSRSSVSIDDKQSMGNPIYISVLYGLINATIVLPVLMSFGAIIYRDPAFAPYMNLLVKLTVASGIIHQLCFSTLSSLPFAVGQVQDAGLIFLSGMATQTVQYCHEHGYDDETMLATVTVGLGLCTGTSRHMKRPR